jgi:simple sugar transport system permease protein
MVVISMVISGGIAALVGLPLLFGDTHSYGTTFQSGLGFAGIAVALLGRNNPIGIAFGALLFAFLVEQSSLLEIKANISNDIVSITQGVLVLCVVVAYEIVRRYTQAQEQRAVAEQLAPATTEVAAR